MTNVIINNVSPCVYSEWLSVSAVTGSRLIHFFVAFYFCMHLFLLSELRSLFLIAVFHSETDNGPARKESQASKCEDPILFSQKYKPSHWMQTHRVSESVTQESAPESNWYLKGQMQVKHLLTPEQSEPCSQQHCNFAVNQFVHCFMLFLTLVKSI